MDDADIKAIFCALERVTPAPAKLDGHALSDVELLEAVFGMGPTDAGWRRELRGDQINLSRSSPHWFVTDLELEVDAAWLTDSDLRRVAADLERFHVRAKLERIDRSLSQPEERYRLRLRLWMVRRPGEPPPPRQDVNYGMSVIGRGDHVVTCDHCNTVHELTTGAKGNIGDSSSWATEYCLKCSRGVFDINFYGGYSLSLAVPKLPSPSRVI